MKVAVGTIVMPLHPEGVAASMIKIFENGRFELLATAENSCEGLSKQMSSVCKFLRMTDENKEIATERYSTVGKGLIAQNAPIYQGR